MANNTITKAEIAEAKRNPEGAVKSYYDLRGKLRAIKDKAKENQEQILDRAVGAGGWAVGALGTGAFEGYVRAKAEMDGDPETDPNAAGTISGIPYSMIAGGLAVAAGAAGIMMKDKASQRAGKFALELGKANLAIHLGIFASTRMIEWQMSTEAPQTGRDLWQY